MFSISRSTNRTTDLTLTKESTQPASCLRLLHPLTLPPQIQPLFPSLLFLFYCCLLLTRTELKFAIICFSIPSPSPARATSLLQSTPQSYTTTRTSDSAAPFLLDQMFTIICLPWVQLPDFSDSFLHKIPPPFPPLNRTLFVFFSHLPRSTKQLYRTGDRQKNHTPSPSFCLSVWPWLVQASKPETTDPIFGQFFVL